MLKFLFALAAMALPAFAIPTPESCGRLLEGGRLTYRAEAAHHSLDGYTQGDLSLNRLIYPTMGEIQTPLGKLRLQWLLAHPYTDRTEILRRQQAVQELMGNEERREAVARELAFLAQALGSSRGQVSWERYGLDIGDPQSFYSYFEDSRTPPSKNVGIFTGAMTAASLVVMTTVVATGRWELSATPLAPWMALSNLAGDNMRRSRLLRARLRADSAVFGSLERLAQSLNGVQSPALQELASVLGLMADQSSERGVSGLAQRLHAVTPRSRWTAAGDFFFGRSAWQGLIELESEVLSAETAARLQHILGAVAELDVFRAFAQDAVEHEGHKVFPLILEQETPTITIDAGHNPVVFERRGEASVANSATITHESNFFVLTGANMGGKSTYLKMVAALTVQAQIGATVTARAMALTPVELMTNIDISDSIGEGKSFFDAETNRIMEVIEHAQKSGRMLVIMDEILLGTNPQERAAAEEAIIQYLQRTGNLFLLATHDLGMARLEGVVPGLSNIHVEEHFVNGRMKFSYQVMPGPSPSRNAIRVLEMKNFPQEITEAAWEYLQRNAAEPTPEDPENMR